VQLNTRQGWPGLAVTTNAGDVVMVHTYGTAAVAGQELCRGTGQQILVALDGQDLRQSSALLLAPLESGTLALPPRDRASVALVGDFVQGKWTVAESIPLPADAWRLDIDDDRATMVILLCPADEQQRWGAHLEQALQRPDQLEGW